MSTTSRRVYYTTGQLADLLGVRPWQLARLVRKGKIAEPPHLPPHRVWTAADVPRVRAALVAAGYQPAEEVTHAQ